MLNCTQKQPSNHDHITNLRLTEPIVAKPQKKKQTEEKAKVVAAVWGTEFIQFHAALQI